MAGGDDLVEPGEAVASKLSKGFVTVTGRLELNTWDQDGEHRSRLRIVALEVTAPDFFAKSEDIEPEAEANPDAARRKKAT